MVHSKIIQTKLVHNVTKLVKLVQMEIIHLVKFVMLVITWMLNNKPA